MKAAPLSASCSGRVMKKTLGRVVLVAFAYLGLITPIIIWAKSSLSNNVATVLAVILVALLRVLLYLVFDENPTEEKGGARKP